MSSSDSFTARFDSIEIDRARAPSPAAIDEALAIAAPTAAAPELEPGFYLLNNAGGLFTVDREFGFISVVNEDVLAREINSVRNVTLRVVERSGESYTLDLTLRITGMTPQVVGAEDFDLTPVVATTGAEKEAASTAPALSWHIFAAALARRGKSPLTQTAGAFIAAPLPTAVADVVAALTMIEPAPAPFHPRAAWSV